MTAFVRAVSQALLPSHCLLCSASSTAALCAACMKSLSSDQPPRCTVCGLRMALDDASEASPCGQCLKDPPAFHDSLIVMDYKAPVDALIQDLKFRAQLPLANAFGQLLADAAGHRQGRTDTPADVLLPVPLSRERLEQRGFNQAMELARPVAEALGLPLLAGSCVRTRNTSAQTALPVSQRRVNMRGAFAVRDRTAIENRHVMVIDDVMTTGHTLRELAACLKRHGAARVSNLVLARTPMR